jgi:hypothetical protein
MPADSSSPAGRMARTLDPAGWRPFAEWALWLGLAAFAWVQIGFFDRDLPHYAYGTAGWPKLVCLMIAAGATAQLLMRLAKAERDALAPAAVGDRWSKRAQRLLIFALPFLFVWLTPLIGFYVATPFFVLALLLLLEVRKPVALIGVTATVWALVLLIFTRFFYVPLPDGRWDGFYEANVAIIDFARAGL